MFPKQHQRVIEYCSTHTTQECVNFATKGIIDMFKFVGLSLIILFIMLLILRIIEMKKNNLPIKFTQKSFWIDFWLDI